MSAEVGEATCAECGLPCLPNRSECVVCARLSKLEDLDEFLSNLDEERAGLDLPEVSA